MSVLSIIVLICAVGVLLWAINSFLPMHPSVKSILNIVVILLLVVWLLKVFGVWGYLAHLHI